MKKLGIAVDSSKATKNIPLRTVRHSGGIRLTKYRKEKEHAAKFWENIVKIIFLTLFLVLLSLLVYNFFKNA